MKHFINIKNGYYFPNIFHRIRNEQVPANFAMHFEQLWVDTNSNMLRSIVEGLQETRIRPIDYVDVEI